LLTNKIVARALEHLEGAYVAKTVLLYGSFSTQTQTRESDIDVVVFAEVETPCHDSTLIEGHRLDAWVYPADQRAVDHFLHIVPFETLKDELGLADELRLKIEGERLARTRPLTPQEFVQLESWISKMVARSRGDSAEGNYRYHWLLNDFPELYCRLAGRYYEGPVKTIRRMKRDDGALHEKYERVLASGKDPDRVEALYAEMVRRHLASRPSQETR
jgi:predicted nucleotidyltransferase